MGMGMGTITMGTVGDGDKSCRRAALYDRQCDNDDEATARRSVYLSGGLMTLTTSGRL